MDKKAIISIITFSFFIILIFSLIFLGYKQKQNFSVTSTTHLIEDIKKYTKLYFLNPVSYEKPTTVEEFNVLEQEIRRILNLSGEVSKEGGPVWGLCGIGNFNFFETKPIDELGGENEKVTPKEFIPLCSIKEISSLAKSVLGGKYGGIFLNPKTLSEYKEKNYYCFVVSPKITDSDFSNFLKQFFKESFVQDLKEKELVCWHNDISFIDSFIGVFGNLPIDLSKINIKLLELSQEDFKMAKENPEFLINNEQFKFDLLWELIQ
jgi:hypothetical protein